MVNQSVSSPRPADSRTQQYGLDIKDIIAFIWNLRFWILLSVGVCVLVAFVYIRFQAPLYERSARVLLESQSGSNSEMVVLSDLTGIQTNSNIANEVFILQCPRLMTQVVNDLELHTRYYSKFVPRTPDPNEIVNKYFSIKTYEYYKDSPFTMEIIKDPLFPNQSLPTRLRFDIINAPYGGFYFQKPTTPLECQLDTTMLHHYGDTIVFRGYSILFKARVLSQLKAGSKFFATWTDPEVLGTMYAGRLSAIIESGAGRNLASKTDVITLSFTDTKSARAEDILNTLIYEYNQETLRYKNASVLNSIEFIDNRLAIVTKELEQVENKYLDYQSSRSLVDIQTQSQMALTSDMDYEKQLSEIRLQSSVLEMIKDGITGMREDEYKVIPSDIGLSDASLGTVISSYNTLVSERNKMLANSSESNPRVRNLNQQLRDEKNSILLSIENLEKAYIIRENELSNILRQSKNRMSAIPTQQFDLSQIERKQQIIEPLYLLLQQKKEEAQISIYSMTESARVIEDAHGSNIPISPKGLQIYLLAFVIGLCIPMGVVLCSGFLRTTIVSREDIKKVLNVPVLAVIPQTKDPSVEWDSSARDLKSESFRMLRSSLQFLSGNIIQITSSTRDEGKSFIASNLAVSIAHTGKKVVLMGMDLRKPVLVHRFPKMKVEKHKSIVGYLIGKCDDPSQILHQWERYPNLNIAFSGSIPPNPTELLDSDRLGTLIGWMKEHFDYVIIDSAPILLVSDSVLINRYVDSTIYIVRSEYTPLKLLPDIKLLFEQSQIHSPKFVINRIDMDSKIIKYGYGYLGYGYGYGRHRYGYGYGNGCSYGYGYGYGYGNGNGNGDENGKRRHHSIDKKNG